jgi:iron complex outermembrane receptor protein
MGGNSEQKSAGYALLNVRGFWEINSRVKLGLSADNLTDKKYRDHLAGVNRVSRNPDIALGERLPGYGRSISLRFDYQF